MAKYKPKTTGLQPGIFNPLALGGGAFHLLQICCSATFHGKDQWCQSYIGGEGIMDSLGTSHKSEWTNSMLLNLICQRTFPSRVHVSNTPHLGLDQQLPNASNLPKCLNKIHQPFSTSCLRDLQRVCWNTTRNCNQLPSVDLSREVVKQYAKSKQNNKSSVVGIWSLFL